MELQAFFGLKQTNPEHMKRLDKVLAMKEGKDRWRAAANLYLYLNPKSYGIDSVTREKYVKMDARTEAKLIAEECAELREQLALAGNEMGKSDDKNSGRRYALRMPATMLQFIEILDPLLHSGSVQERKDSMHELMRTFPEFCVLTRI